MIHCYNLDRIAIFIAMFFIICRSVVLVPDEAEDMWHAYNLIAVGDRLKATTIR